MRRYRNYIFDFDGTLMDTSGVILATIQAAIEKMGLPARTEAQCRAVIGLRLEETGHHLFPEIEISDSKFARIYREIFPSMQQLYPARPFPKVLECLESLCKDGHPMAIASSRRKESIREFLDELGANDWFELIIGADEVTHGKPNPEPVIRILDTLGWNQKETLVVGDADVDILMGSAAGCATCAVTYGNGTLPSLKASNPTYLINRLDSLL